jgi:hypothetical protein
MQYFKATDEFSALEGPVFLRSSDGFDTELLTDSGRWQRSFPLGLQVYAYKDTGTPGVSWTEITAEDLPDGVEP